MGHECKLQLYNKYEIIANMFTLNAATTPNKILLSTAERLGDAVFCTPAIHLLKKHLPQVQFDVMTFGNAAADIYSNNPDIHQIHRCQPNKQARNIASEYPLVITLFHEFLQFLNPLPTRLESIESPNRQKHRTEQILNYVQQLLQCELSDEDRKYQIFPSDNDRKKVELLLKSVGVDLQQDILIGSPLGCHRVGKRSWKIWSKTRHIHRKVWPIENYAALANRLMEMNPRIRFIITGAESEKFLSDTFMKLTPGAINLIGKTSPPEMAALFDHLNLYVTHDTGSLHIACARKTPLIALFGPTPVEFTGPYPLSNPFTLLKKNVISDISVDEVYNAISLQTNLQGNLP
jgi:ADP-heptose:LPS heptosyltransferase